jgi:hypothetical protein
VQAIFFLTSAQLRTRFFALCRYVWLWHGGWRVQTREVVKVLLSQLCGCHMKGVIFGERARPGHEALGFWRLGAFLDLPCYRLRLWNWLSQRGVDIGNGTCGIRWCYRVGSAFHSRAPLQAERLHDRCRRRLSRSDGLVRARTVSTISTTRSLTWLQLSTIDAPSL